MEEEHDQGRLFNLPSELVLRVLIRVYDVDQRAGARSLAAFASTCRAAQGLANDVARASLQAASLNVSAFAEGADVGDVPRPRGAGWMHALLNSDLASWWAISLPLFFRDVFRTVAKTPVRINGESYLLTCGPSGLARWRVGSTDHVQFTPCAVPVEVIAALHFGLVATAAATNPGLVHISCLDSGQAEPRRAVQTGCKSIRALIGCGKLVVAAGEDTHVACFNAHSGERLAPLLRHAPGEAILAQGGATLAIAHSGRIHIFEQKSPSERLHPRQVLRGDGAHASSALAVLPSGLLAAADGFGLITVWAPLSKSDVGYWAGDRWATHLRLETLDAETDARTHSPLALYALRDRFVMSCHAEEGAIKLWNAFEGYLLARMPSQGGVRSLGCAPAMFVAIDGNSRITVWRPLWRPHNVSARVVVVAEPARVAVCATQ